MESSKTATEKVIAPAALIELVGSASVQVTTEVEAGKTEDFLAISMETMERLELPKSSDLITKALEKHASLGGTVHWIEVPVHHPRQFVCYKWIASPPPKKEEISPEALHEIVGSVVVILVGKMKDSATSGDITIPLATKERLKLPDSPNLVTEALEKYATFDGRVQWRAMEPLPDEFLRYKWIAVRDRRDLLTDTAARLITHVMAPAMYSTAYSTVHVHTIGGGY